MIVRYWQPFQEIETIRQQLDNIFEDPTPTTTDWIPAVDLIDTGNDYVLEVVLPGLKADDINIEASRKSVTLSGERSAPETGDDQHVLRRERRYGSFQRSITLPRPARDIIERDGEHTVNAEKREAEVSSSVRYFYL